MSATGSTVRPRWWRIVFTLATAPARLVGRWHPDLRTSVEADAATFDGPSARTFFVLLAALAVVYPVAASIVHAVGAAPPRAESLVLALRPFFDVVYSESLPFMIAAAGIGMFCPALGVLFMAVFVPADLIAASRSPVELQALQKFGWFPAPILGRTISYALLWILAVEIPLRARGWASAWAGRPGSEPSLVAGVAGRICATAILVYVWARAHPWLIRPVFSWTPYQFTFEASTPTWNEWPILVTATTAIACVSAMWPRAVQVSSASIGSMEPAPEPSLHRVLLRQTVAALILVGLLAGVLTTAVETVILLVGLLVTGPVVTLVLSRVQVPAVIGRAPTALRWVAAMAISLTIGWAILTLAGDAIIQNNFVLVVTLAIVTPLFRFLLEVGADSPTLAQAARPGPPASVVILAVLGLTLVCSVVFPSVAWAHDCPQELGECLRLSLQSPLGLLAAAMLMGAAAMAERRRREQRAQWWEQFFRDSERRWNNRRAQPWDRQRGSRK